MLMAAAGSSWNTTVYSLLNAVFNLAKSDCVQLLCQLHWLKAAERIDYKLTLLVYKCRLGVALPYLADELSQLARASLRSTMSSSLFVRRTRLSTIGDRAFPVAAARVWNCLPQHVTSAQSLSTFRSRLKTHLFSCCYPAVKPEKWFLYSGCSCLLLLILILTLTQLIPLILLNPTIWQCTVLGGELLPWCGAQETLVIVFDNFTEE